MKRGDLMPRQEAIKQLKEQLVRRHEALQRAVDGDLSLLRELHQEKTGDVLDAAADSVQDELNSQLVEVIGSSRPSTTHLRESQRARTETV